MSVQVRKAGPGDADAIGRLVGAVYLGEGWSGESARPRLTDGAWVMAQGRALVAIQEGAVIGSVVVTLPGDAGRQIGAEQEAEFRLLAVSPAARGSGAGEQLVRAVIAEAGAARLAAVVLSTQEGMAAAQRLYARLGFQRAPERDWARGSGTKMVAFTLSLPADSGSERR